MLALAVTAPLGQRVRPVPGDHLASLASARGRTPAHIRHWGMSDLGREAPGEGRDSFPRTVVGAWPGGPGCVLLLGREVVLVEQVKDGDGAVRAAQLLPHRFG
jgi:hypothetical protein